MAFKRCALCGAYLDPGERCDCEAPDVPEMEIRTPVKAKRKSYAQLEAEYLQRLWDEYDMR